MERFEKEIRLIQRLSHPNIIQIINYSIDDDKFYYIMPRLKCSLSKIIPELYNKIDRQYKVISEILNGLEYLHSEGVIHRDLKPQNILYNSDTDIVISDFGLSRQVNSDSTRLTQTGIIFGTLRYASPEQLYNSGSVDERTDIFAVGVLIKAIVSNDFNNPINSPEINYLIEKCTENNPDKRFSSVVQLRSAVDTIYKRLLGIEETTELESLLSKLKVGKIDYNEIHKLSLKLLNEDNKDKIEEYFFNIPEALFLDMEKNESSLLESLVIKLQEYFTNQSWGFSYTDTIGTNCLKLYNVSQNETIRANLLYTIIQVGISHNRFYVMDIAANLLAKLKGNIAEDLKLVDLLSNGNIDLSVLKISKEELPESLRKYY